MRSISLTGLSLAVVVPAVVVVMAACSKDPPPPVAPTSSAQPVYPMPGTQPGQPQPTGAPTAPVAGQMATPGPTALACQNDSQCLTHHCNTQYGKCAFPCVSDVDCIQGTTCLGGGSPLAACMPKGPGAP